MTSSKANPWATITPLQAPIMMTVEEWRQVPDNPRQRNTERHLKKATYLAHPSPAQLEVKMAVGPGFRCKIDGHTRSLKWEREPHLAPPHKLAVTVYKVSSLTEAADLYTHFDAIQAAESPTDKISGAFHEIGFHPTSSIMRRGAITAALQLVHSLSLGLRQNRLDNPPPIYTLVKTWEREIRRLDEIASLAKKADATFKTATIAAALITLHVGGERAAQFWTSVSQDLGIKLENECDGVEAANRIIRASAGSKTAQLVHLVGRCLSCYERWCIGKTYKLRHFNIKETDPTTYLSIRATTTAKRTKDVQSDIMESLL